MNKLYPYIRGTNKKYGTDDNGGFWGENGYNCIETGYINDDGTEVIELYTCAEVITMGDFLQTLPPGTSMDCVGEGYLRIYAVGNQSLKWQSELIPLSQMNIVFGTPNNTIVKKKRS